MNLHEIPRLHCLFSHVFADIYWVATGTSRFDKSTEVNPMRSQERQGEGLFHCLSCCLSFFEGQASASWGIRRLTDLHRSKVYIEPNISHPIAQLCFVILFDELYLMLSLYHFAQLSPLWPSPKFFVSAGTPSRAAAGRAVVLHIPDTFILSLCITGWSILSATGCQPFSVIQSQVIPCPGCFEFR